MWNRRRAKRRPERPHSGSPPSTGGPTMAVSSRRLRNLQLLLRAAHETRGWPSGSPSESVSPSAGSPVAANELPRVARSCSSQAERVFQFGRCCAKARGSGFRAHAYVWNCWQEEGRGNVSVRLAHRLHYLPPSNTSRVRVPPTHPTYLPARPPTYQRKPVTSVAGFFFCPDRPSIQSGPMDVATFRASVQDRAVRTLSRPDLAIRSTTARAAPRRDLTHQPVADTRAQDRRN
jgi:hypothetical protein